MFEHKVMIRIDGYIHEPMKNHYNERIDNQTNSPPIVRTWS